MWNLFLFFIIFIKLLIFSQKILKDYMSIVAVNDRAIKKKTYI